MGKWRENMAAQADAGRDPIAPQYVVSVLDELASGDAVLTCDSGTIATWAARGWTIRGGREFFLSGNLATMAPGLPYAIGIQHAFPGRQVIGYVGDGGFAMLMAEFITAIKHDLPVKIVINDNNSLGQILWEQMVLGYPEHGVRYSEPFVDYAALASANGALGSVGRVQPRTLGADDLKADRSWRGLRDMAQKAFSQRAHRAASRSSSSIAPPPCGQSSGGDCIRPGSHTYDTPSRRKSGVSRARILGRRRQREGFEPPGRRAQALAEFVSALKRADEHSAIARRGAKRASPS